MKAGGTTAWKQWGLRDGKRYAMKIFTKAKLALLDVSGMLEEVSILWHLKHPNVIRFHDVLEDERHYYLVTEYMAGGELFDRITQKSTYTEKEARDLFKVLVSAIEYMHSMDVVHRDLKPENLLLAAPEILRREPYGKPVDMWSIGVITFILLAGYAPFYDEDHRRLFNKIKKAKFQFEEDTWENISVEAQDLISGLLCVDPAQRLTPSQALAHPWVMADDELLRAKKLTGTQAALKRFNARRKFRASVHSVIMANKLLAVARERSLTRRESDCSASEEEGREKGKDLLPCLPVGLVQ
ncbi:calcium-dependent protein [Nannochloropsis gaditana CCMP526]|uniref:calcium-dependent protein n=1 Tax=Nannochloropsis gaditana (strain CCMP526) TaxID=1093141 RepID=UPI00029F5899|nr:calcium-dependent protein [Nannochloropsis gaditana CCMP526]EKU21977.1 calcium-dependent protein [Nannochloropsis gaditana CCMP526]|eukprot:XP_005854383.1 calcium-dependent protein [Nannochloropsis gaditana CCMP526]